jgi:hypothetical protein
MHVPFTRGVVVVAFLASACQMSAGDRAVSGATAPAPGTRLTADQIRTDLVGKTATGRTSSGGDYAFYVAPDGTFRLRELTGGGRSSDGTYRITSDDQFCATYTSLGRTFCYLIYKDGKTYRSVLDGQVATTYTVTPGNPQNL